MKYHLYRREQKGVTLWYVWYYDQNGIRIRKSTSCEKKRDAELFVEQLEYCDSQKEIDKGRTMFSDYTAGFFDPCSVIVTRWNDHGKLLKPVTLSDYAAYLKNYLLPWFGNFYLDQIDAKALDDNLINARKINRSLDKTRVMPILSGSSKNEIRNTLVIILTEAVFDKKISSVPNFKKFSRNSRHQNTLSVEQIQILFPFDQSVYGKVWESPGDMLDHIPGIMFATMAAVAVSCGLRSGEVCALSYEQIIPNKGFIIDRMLDEKGQFALPKKGTEEDPRFRAVPVSDYTFQLLNRWIAIRGKEPGLLFTYHGHAVSGNYLLRRFKRALLASGIDTTSKRITFHGLRYTFNTRMKNKMSRSALHDMIGHMDDQMTDLYDRPIMEERMDELREKNIDALNSFWKVI